MWQEKIVRMKRDDEDVDDVMRRYATYGMLNVLVLVVVALGGMALFCWVGDLTDWWTCK